MMAHNEYYNMGQDAASRNLQISTHTEYLKRIRNFSEK